MVKDIFLCFPFENLSLFICRKYDFFIKVLSHERATSKTWTRTLKNRDPEKPGISIGLKNMSDFRELCFIKIIHNVSYCLKVRVLTDI